MCGLHLPRGPLFSVLYVIEQDFFQNGCLYEPGPCLNIKTVLPCIGGLNLKIRPPGKESYLFNGNPYAGTMASFYWNNPPEVYRVSLRIHPQTCPQSAAVRSLAAPCHYPKQCWLIISEVPWHLYKEIVMRTNQNGHLSDKIEKKTLFFCHPRSIAANNQFSISLFLIQAWRCIFGSVSAVTVAWGNALSPVRYQAITGTNAGLLSTGPPGTNFAENLIKARFFSTKLIWKCRMECGCHFVQVSTC